MLEIQDQYVVQVVQHLQKVATEAQSSCHSSRPIRYRSQVVMVEARSRNDVGVTLTIADGSKIEAEVVVAADGANSTLKKVSCKYSLFLFTGWSLVFGNGSDLLFFLEK